MDLGIAGRRALVSGGSLGIGRAVVDTLLRDGCSVAFCARNADGVKAAVHDLEPIGPVIGDVCDFTDDDVVRAGSTVPPSSLAVSTSSSAT